MANYKIVDLTEITNVADLNDSSFVLIEKDGTQYKLSAVTLKNYINSGINVADILTTTNTKTVTNKTFTSPKINENVALTSTSSDLNLLDGVTAGAADFSKLTGLTSNIKDSLNTINSKLVTTNFQSFSMDILGSAFTTGVYTITASDIKDQLGLPDTLAYSFATITKPALYTIPASATTMTRLETSGYTFAMLPELTTSSQSIIKDITITITGTVTTTTTYRICMLLQRVNASNIVQSVAYSNDTQSNL